MCELACEKDNGEKLLCYISTYLDFYNDWAQIL